MKKVFVAGTGCITSAGNDSGENLTALTTGKSGLEKLRRLDSAWKDKLYAGEVKLSNDQVAEKTGIENKNLSRNFLLGLKAVKEALRSFPEDKGYKAGLVSGTTVGGMDNTEDFYRDFLRNNTKGKISKVAGHDCGYITEAIASQCPVFSFTSTISTACSSGANAVIMAARMIRAGRLDMAVAGGTDCLTRFTVNGFNSLMIYDNGICRPFDKERKGLNLGEGAGYILLVSEEVLIKEGLTPLALVTGYGNANDAFHQTASSPEGTGNYLAMKEALQTAGLAPEDISYINAHGTGTSNNDHSCGKALNRLFNGNIPDISSTKGFTGHTLGAAGGIEAVYSVLALMHQVKFPNLFFENHDPETGVTPLTQLKEGKVDHVLSNSFGFGGNCTSLVFTGA